MRVDLLALACAGAMLAAGAAVAADLPENVFAATTDDNVQDVVFFSEARPVFLRFHVQVEDKGFRTAWTGFVQRLHRFLDGNGDGVLTLDEAQRGTWQQLLQSPFGGRANFRSFTTKAPTSLDSGPTDGKVSVDELANFLRKTLDFGDFDIQTGQPPDPRTQAAFNHLDLDHDGKLAPDELAATDSCLIRLDTDEDEMVSLSEMVPYRNPYAQQFLAVQPTAQPGPGNAPFVALGSGETRSRLVGRLLTQYGKRRRSPASGSTPKLSRDELGINEKVFREADTDGDGALDTAELEGLLNHISPDLELVVKLAKLGTGQSKVERVQSGSRAPGAVWDVFTNPNGALVVVLEGTEFEFQTFDGGQNARDFYLMQFKNADGDNNGYLEAKEARQNGFFQQLMAVADRDGDGKLFEKELVAYLDQQADAMGSRTILSVSDQGRPLFELLDANHDQKLGRRELREASRRLKAVDKDGDARVALTELPRHYQLSLGRGQAPNNQGAMSIQTYSSGPARNRSAPGGPPSWFLGMDRNRDNDVSPREFLGPADDFRRLDADGDGLIDAKEAARTP